MKCFRIFKIIAFIILIWIYETDKYTFIFRNFKGKFNDDRTLNRNFNRSLGVYENEKNFKNQRHGENVSYNTKNKDTTNNMNYRSTYKYLKKGELNELKSYNKGYKKRYSKKKGLAKLECYCEKKLFDKIYYLDNMTNKRKNHKDLFLKKVYHKFGINFIIIALISLFGLVMSILFGSSHGKGLIEWCDGTTNSGCKPNECKDKYYSLDGDLIKHSKYFNQVTSYIGIIIVFLFTMYFFIKIIKYQKIKAGIRKMNAKELYRLLKDLL